MLLRPLRLLLVPALAAVVACSPRNGLVPPGDDDDSGGVRSACADLVNSWPAVGDAFLDYEGEAASEGALVPDFEAPDQLAEAMCLSQLLGAPLVLDFSTRWCGPCNEAAAESPGLFAQMRQIGPSWLATVMVQSATGADATQADVEQWVDLYLPDDDPTLYPVVLDVGQEIAAEYGVTSFPVFLFVAPDGEVAARLEYKPTEAEILEFIEAYSGT